MPHAQACMACAGHLRAAMRLGKLLAQRPEVPAEVRDPGLLEAIHVRATQSMLREPGGMLLQGTYGRPPVLPAIPWPLQQDASGLARQGATSGGSAPGWLWTRIRDDLRQQVAKPVLRRRAVLAAVAASLVLALALSKFVGSDGSPADVQIVFIPVDEMPLVDHPAAILRRGGRQ